MATTAEARREYFRNRQAQRRNHLIGLLGGCCVKCSSSESLQFDHVDPGTMEFRLSGWAFNYSWKRILAEASKCQLLCMLCHLDKSRANGDFGGGSNKLADDKYVHGSPRTYKYRGCRCTLCKTAQQHYKRGDLKIDEAWPRAATQPVKGTV